MRALGCEVIPDGVSEDLNATLVQAAAEVVRRWPDAVPVALCADLPGLRPGELVAVLAEAADAAWRRGLQPSCATGPASGRRSTPLPADRFDPHFGIDSAASATRPPAPSRWGRTPRACAPTSTTSATSARRWSAGVGPHTSRASGRRATPLG